MQPPNPLSPDPAGGIDDTGSFFAGLVPDPVALRCLSVELRAPREIVVGEPTTFLLRIRNRLPAPVSVRLPTSRLWGWAVDGIPEADERGFEPPETSRTVAFRTRETKQFEGAWDGHIRRAGIDGDVWRPEAGTHTLSVHLATEDPRRQLSDSVQVTVVSSQS